MSDIEECSALREQWGDGTAAWSLSTFDAARVGWWGREAGMVTPRHRRHEEFLELLRSCMVHPWELTIWLPPLPFHWPTTQKAICA